MAQLSKMADTMSGYISLLLEERVKEKSARSASRRQGRRQAWQTSLETAQDPSIQGAMRAARLAQDEDAPEYIREGASAAMVTPGEYTARKQQQLGEREFATFPQFEPWRTQTQAEMKELFPDMETGLYAGFGGLDKLRNLFQNIKSGVYAKGSAALGNEKVETYEWYVNAAGERDFREVTLFIPRLAMAQNPDLLRHISIGKSAMEEMLAKHRARGTAQGELDDEVLARKLAHAKAMAEMARDVEWDPEHRRRMLAYYREYATATMEGNALGQFNMMDETAQFEQAVNHARTVGTTEGQKEVLYLTEEILRQSAAATKEGNWAPDGVKLEVAGKIALVEAGIIGLASEVSLAGMKAIEEAKLLGQNTDAVAKRKAIMVERLTEAGIVGAASEEAIAAMELTLKAKLLAESDPAVALAQALAGAQIAKHRTTAINEAELDHLTRNYKSIFSLKKLEAAALAGGGAYGKQIIEATAAADQQMSQMREIGHQWNQAVPQLEKWLNQTDAGRDFREAVEGSITDELRAQYTGHSISTLWNAAFLNLVESKPREYGNLWSGMPDVERYFDARKAYQPTLARYFGQRGNLTQLEQENAALMLPSVTDLFHPNGMRGADKLARLLGGIIATPQILTEVSGNMPVWDTNIRTTNPDGTITEGGFIEARAHIGNRERLEKIDAIITAAQRDILAHYQLGQQPGMWSSETYGGVATGMDPNNPLMPRDNPLTPRRGYATPTAGAAVNPGIATRDTSAFGEEF